MGVKLGWGRESERRGSYGLQHDGNTENLFFLENWQSLKVNVMINLHFIYFCFTNNSRTGNLDITERYKMKSKSHITCPFSEITISL